MFAIEFVNRCQKKNKISLSSSIFISQAAKHELFNLTFSLAPPAILAKILKFYQTLWLDLPCRDWIENILLYLLAAGHQLKQNWNSPEREGRKGGREKRKRVKNDKLKIKKPKVFIFQGKKTKNKCKNKERKNDQCSL